MPPAAMLFARVEHHLRVASASLAPHRRAAARRAGGSAWETSVGLAPAPVLPVVALLQGFLSGALQWRSLAPVQGAGGIQPSRATNSCELSVEAGGGPSDLLMLVGPRVNRTCPRTP
jgi:hypothetical protein